MKYEGVIPVYFLKAVLKAEIDLNPTELAIDSIVIPQFFWGDSNFLASLILYSLINELKFFSNF